MAEKNNENNIIITSGMSGNDLVVATLFATFMMIAGAVAFVLVRQMDTPNTSMQDVSMSYPYNVTPYNVQPQITNNDTDDFVPPMAIDAPSSTAVHDFTITQETHETELSPVTFLGYNTTGDLVGVMKRMPNGEVMRRKIRDPEMSISNLEVDRWVEYNDWKKETDMDWI